MTPQFPIEEDEGGGMPFSPWFYFSAIVSGAVVCTFIAVVSV